MSSTKIDTLVPSLYQCVETRSIGLSYFGTSVSTSSSSAKRLPLRWQFLDPAVNDFSDKHSHRKQEIFLYEYSLH
jgi:hypothetical protein